MHYVMDKEIVVHIYNGIFPSHKKEQILVVMKWMNPEPVIQSKVRKRKI